MFDVARQGLVNAQPVVGEQGDERGGAWPVGFGLLEQRLELVARVAGGHRVVRNPRAFDVRDGVFVEHADLHAVAVEARQTRQPAGDRRRHADLPGRGVRRVGEPAGP